MAPKAGTELPVSVNTTEMVQYMVEKGLTKVPPEFVLPPQHRPSSTNAMKLPSALEIPVIDMTGFQHDQAVAARVVSEIGRACERWGFFQVRKSNAPNSYICTKFHHTDLSMYLLEVIY